MDIERFIIQYWNSVVTQDEEEIKKYFHEDASVRWHNTNEQFTVVEFLRANCDYPGRWSGKVERMELIGSSVITVTHVWTKGMSFHVISFFEIKGDKIKNIDEYWGDDGTAPQWRQDKQIGSPIR